MNNKTQAVALAALTVAALAVTTGPAIAESAAEPVAAAVPAVPVDQAPNVAAPVSDDFDADLHAAWEAGNMQAGIATAPGVAAGTAIGIPIGCVLGAVTGGTMTAIATAGTLTIPVGIAGCLVGAAAVGGVGAVLGGAAAAIPAGLYGGVTTFNQLRAQHSAGGATAPAPAQG
ncbi:hypothetical protein ACFYXQ_07300 [Nocardia jiangxiensis]|uniref:Uncharacterized protein n=1 Tax=Nocardia jiangxiensis TaxID=282685 RepID=A0ABW6RXB8_9NOCA